MAEIMIKAAGFVFVIIIAFVLKQVHVLEKRDDGYHNVDMISVPIGLHDHVEITELVQGNETFLTCDDIELVCDESNLALKAYKAMQENFQIKKPPKW